jgi:hypothetical protein
MEHAIHTKTIFILINISRLGLMVKKPKLTLWGKYDTVAFIHTHGRYHKGTNYSNKYFSGTDINISNNTGMPMYVVLPSGICCYHNPNNQNENRSFKWSGVYHDKKALSKHRSCKLCVNYLINIICML